MFKLRMFQHSDAEDLEREFDLWVEDLKKDGYKVIVENTTQSVGEYQIILSILYRLQKSDIEVTPEIPTTVGEFQVTEYTKGKTLNFKLFLTEEELSFLSDEGSELLIGGVPMLEYSDSLEHLAYLKSLRVKGVLQNFTNADGEEVFVGTELGKYLWESFLKLELEK